MFSELIEVERQKVKFTLSRLAMGNRLFCSVDFVADWTAKTVYDSTVWFLVHSRVRHVDPFLSLSSVLRFVF